MEVRQKQQQKEDAYRDDPVGTERYIADLRAAKDLYPETKWGAQPPPRMEIAATIVQVLIRFGTDADAESKNRQEHSKSDVLESVVLQDLYRTDFGGHTLMSILAS